MTDSDLLDDFVVSNGRGRRLDRAGLDPKVTIELDRYLGRPSPQLLKRSPRCHQFTPIS